MSNNGRKLNQYLSDLQRLSTDATNLTNAFHRAVIVIDSFKADPRPIVADRNFIDVTEAQLYNDQQNLALELNVLNQRLQSFTGRPLNPNDHMSMLVLGSDYGQWTDRYMSLVVTPSMNVVQHIQNSQFQFQQTLGGVAHV